MINSIRNVAVACVLSLALSGCAAQYEMANPIDQCNGLSVGLTTTDNRPVAQLSQDTGSTNRDTRFTLQVTRESDAISFDNLRIEYRLGLYNSIGFNEATLNSFGLSGTTSRDSFLDLMAFAGPLALTVDTSRFEAVPGDSNSIQISGTFTELTLGLDAPDLIFTSSASVERTYLLGFLVYPGAFLLSCSEEDATINEYTSAAQMFPNLEALDQIPLFDAESQTIFIETPEHFIGLEAQGIAVPVPTAEVSRDLATTAWLQLISSTQGEQSALFSGTVERSQTIDRVIGVSQLANLDEGELAEGSYILFFFVVSPGLLFEEGEVEISSEVVFRTAMYLVDVAADGGATIENLTELEYPNVPNSSSRNQPTLESAVKTWRVSTKGFRELVVSGTNLGNINQILIGGQLAKIKSASYSGVELTLPRMRAGTYPMTFAQGSNLVAAKQEVRYYLSKKVFETRITPAQETTSWSRLLTREIASTKVVQVNCLARVPEGSASKKLSTLATSVCNEVAKLKPEIKVKTLVVKATAGSRGDVLVRFWD